MTYQTAKIISMSIYEMDDKLRCEAHIECTATRSIYKVCIPTADGMTVHTVAREAIESFNAGKSILLTAGRPDDFLYNHRVALYMQAVQRGERDICDLPATLKNWGYF